MKKRSTKKLGVLMVVVGVFVLISASSTSAQISINLDWQILPNLELIQTTYQNIWSSEIIAKISLIHGHLTFIAANPLPNPWISSEDANQAIGILEGITAFLINPQSEPSIPPERRSQFVPVMDRITAILINPQPEPPALPAEMAAKVFNVLDRLSSLLLDAKNNSSGRISAHLHAMDEITRRYVTD